MESKAIAHKAQELGKSKSGIDLSSYNPIEKILDFTPLDFSYWLKNDFNSSFF